VVRTFGMTVTRFFTATLMTCARIRGPAKREPQSRREA
jgi:hypothetical protein